MSDMYECMYVCMCVCTKSFLKTTTNSLCVCAHLANKADSDSDSDSDVLVAYGTYFLPHSVTRSYIRSQKEPFNWCCGLKRL